MKRSFAIFAAFAVVATGCASTGEGTPEDPWEGWNRGVTGFNNAADKVALGPLSQVYGVLVPDFAKTGVDNFLSNLGEPSNAINSALQGKPERALDASWRFIVNSTVGIGGLFDPAEAMGLEPHSEDFGQTLAVWGVPDGPYVVLPLMGPSTLRDTVAIPIGGAINPLNYPEYGNDEDVNIAIRAGLGTIGAINTRYKLDDQIKALADQPSPYVALRDIYLSSRAAAIRDGVEEEDLFKDLPNFDDYYFEEDFE